MDLRLTYYLKQYIFSGLSVHVLIFSFPIVFFVVVPRAVKVCQDPIKKQTDGLRVYPIPESVRFFSCFFFTFFSYFHLSRLLCSCIKGTQGLSRSHIKQTDGFRVYAVSQTVYYQRFSFPFSYFNSSSVDIITDGSNPTNVYTTLFFNLSNAFHISLAFSRLGQHCN